MIFDIIEYIIEKIENIVLKIYINKTDNSILKMSAASKFSNIVVDDGPYTMADGEEYVPREIKTKEDAYTASLHLIYSHVATFHRTIVSIIANKYKISEDEILNVVVNHPAFKDMQINPLIHSLGYFKIDDVKEAVGPHVKVVRDSTPETPKKRKLENYVIESESEEEEKPPSPPPAPKKPVLVKKKVATKK